MGMVPRAGFGAKPRGSKLTNAPLKLGRSSRQHAFMILSASSLHAPRCSKATPKSSISSRIQPRSEEHTSELQSRLHLVCRLLLEKKKKKKPKPHQSHSREDQDWN